MIIRSGTGGSTASGPASGSPLLTIGMPIYNAARWLQPTLQSLLEQTYGAFELIVSDNASTDDSVKIVEQFARKDDRIRIIRQASNIGANGNYRSVLAAAKSKFFKWASCNDYCAPTFLEKCLAALIDVPDAVLAYPRTVIFIEHREDGEPYEHDFSLLEPTGSTRFLNLFGRMYLNNAMNGVIRRSALVESLPMGSFRAADILLMSELALRGKYILVDEPLFYRRMSAEAATSTRARMDADRHLVPAATRPLQWQYWRYQFRMARIAVRATPSQMERLRCIKVVMHAAFTNREFLFADIVDSFNRSGSP